MGRFGVVALFGLLSLSPQHPPLTPAPTKVPAEQKVVQSHLTIACGIATPTSFGAWWSVADAVVHVRLDTQATSDHPEGNDTEVITTHEATVLDVYKRHPKVMSAGTSLPILQRGGVVARPDGLHRYHWNNFDIMPRGTEWVLFLYWNSYLDGFEVLHFENGAFEIRPDTIVTAGRAEFAERWKGRPASEFLASLESQRR